MSADGSTACAAATRFETSVEGHRASSLRPEGPGLMVDFADFPPIGLAKPGRDRKILVRFSFSHRRLEPRCLWDFFIGALPEGKRTHNPTPNPPHTP